MPAEAAEFQWKSWRQGAARQLRETEKESESLHGGESTSFIHWSDTKEHLSHAIHGWALGHSRDRPPSLSLGTHSVG